MFERSSNGVPKCLDFLSAFFLADSSRIWMGDEGRLMLDGAQSTMSVTTVLSSVTGVQYIVPLHCSKVPSKPSTRLFTISREPLMAFEL